MTSLAVWSLAGLLSVQPGCPNLAGRYVNATSEDGIVHVVITQTACATVSIAWNSSYNAQPVTKDPPATYTVDGKVHVSAGPGSVQTLAVFTPAGLEIWTRRAAPRDTAPLRLTKRVRQLRNGDLCFSFTDPTVPHMFDLRLGRYGTMGATFHDALTRSAPEGCRG